MPSVQPGAHVTSATNQLICHSPSASCTIPGLRTPPFYKPFTLGHYFRRKTPYGFSYKAARLKIPRSALSVAIDLRRQAPVAAKRWVRESASKCFCPLISALLCPGYTHTHSSILLMLVAMRVICQNCLSMTRIHFG